MVIASDDHCPPHVHAGHKGEGWIIRICFSYASSDVVVMSITPTQDAVRQRQINDLLDELIQHLCICRKIWWEGKGTICLDNKWVIAVSSTEVDVLDRPRVGAKRVRSADYDVATRATKLSFWDGTENLIESGEEE